VVGERALRASCNSAMVVGSCDHGSCVDFVSRRAGMGCALVYRGVVRGGTGNELGRAEGGIRSMHVQMRETWKCSSRDNQHAGALFG
jgi:hypothetical protein